MGDKSPKKANKKPKKEKVSKAPNSVGQPKAAVPTV